MIAPTIKMKKITLAMPAAASEIPPNPNIPAMMAITIQTINNLNIIEVFLRLINQYLKVVINCQCDYRKT